MSLVRAFTTRRAKKDAEASAAMPSRSNTTKHGLPAGSIRDKISGPVELLSTTNMLSYNAPNINLGFSAPSPSPSSPPSLIHSSSSSTRSSSEDESVSTPPTSPDVNGRSPSPNHLSCYFEKRSSSPTNDDPTAPQIPQRALSHTKRSHEMIHRKRSISRMSQRSVERSHSVKNSVSSFARDSLQMFSATPELEEDTASAKSAPSSPVLGLPATPSPPPRHNKKASHSQHPFGAELAQVTELAEEYSTVGMDSAIQDGLDDMADNVQIVLDAEEQDILDRGLCRFDASEYMKEIEPLYITAFNDAFRTQMWI